MGSDGCRRCGRVRKTCEFRAHVRYGFQAPPDRKAAMILGFGGGGLEVWPKDRFISFGPFDGSDAEILAITKRLFSRDEFLARFDPGVFKNRGARRLPKPRPARG